MMKRYINFTGGSENVDFLKIFSNIRVLFCSKLMSGQLIIDSNSCVLVPSRFLIVGENVLEVVLVTLVFLHH